MNAEIALSQVVEVTPTRSIPSPTPYLLWRAADVRDVGRRVLEALRQERGAERAEIPEGSIVVAEELLPLVTAHHELNQVRGL